MTEVEYALIGVLDGRPFLQLTSPAVPVLLNGDPVTGTRWLADGDDIGIGSAQIRCALADGTLDFSLRFSGVDYDTLPPEPAAEVAPVAVSAGRPVPPPATAGRPPRWRAALVASALLMLAGTAVWLLTASAVLIATDPAGARVEISGAPDLRLGGRYLLRPGRYTVSASADGYAPGTLDIDVTGEDSQDFRLRLSRLPGRLRVVTKPEVDAEVTVDGTPAGRTPLAELELAAGVHSLAVVAPRYQPWEIALTVDGGGELQIVEAQLTPGWADVSVTSIPDGATVFADGVEAGTTPARLELMPGNRTLTLTKDGFKTLTRLVTAVANQAQALESLTLLPADGLVRIITDPPGAAVTAGGRYRGVTPLETELPPGRTHDLALVKAGYEPATVQADLRSTRGATVRVTLTPRIGIVRIASDPADAELLVDGRSVGAASTELSLPAVRHRLEVRKAGFVPYQTEVTPEPGSPRVLDVKLLTPGQAAAAAVPRVAYHDFRHGTAADSARTTAAWAPRAASRVVAPTKPSGGAPDPAVLPGRPGSHQHAVPGLPAPAYLGRGEVPVTGRRRSPGRHVELGRRGGLLQLAEQPGGAAAGLRAGEERAGSCLARYDRLPAAHRSRVGVGGTL